MGTVGVGRRAYMNLTLTNSATSSFRGPISSVRSGPSLFNAVPRRSPVYCFPTRSPPPAEAAALHRLTVSVHHYLLLKLEEPVPTSFTAAWQPSICHRRSVSLPFHGRVNLAVLLSTVQWISFKIFVSETGAAEMQK
ncbi:hypothetical protein Salat_0094500 [Sesamum alatum]|uniref:Uncharacterized protein n=1 Tax=Sesamum alatum TaxID=300844 RepID=A0AAE1YVZ8_9LAMI|nr:hypothetical protein Salat_0094500 [Sesamum alatum]